MPPYCQFVLSILMLCLEIKKVACRILLKIVIPDLGAGFEIKKCIVPYLSVSMWVVLQITTVNTSFSSLFTHP